MANLKEIRNRIASVSSTMQITSAMKMVSAAKLKKAQDAITAMRPYADKLTELLQSYADDLVAEAGQEMALEYLRRTVRRIPCESHSYRQAIVAYLKAEISGDAVQVDVDTQLLVFDHSATEAYPAAASSPRFVTSAGSNSRWIDSQPTSTAEKAIMPTTKSPARSSARP